MKLLRCALIGAIGVCVMADSVRAETRTIRLHVQWQDALNGEAEWRVGESILGNVHVEGDYSVVHESRHFPGWDIAWEMTTIRGADRVSVVSATSVTNNLATPQVFNFSVSDLAMVDIGAPTQVITSMSLSVADGNGDGATMSDDTVSPIYAAAINGGTVDTLGDPLTLLAGSERTNSVTESNSFGGGAALLSTDMMRIDNVFVLSPGDSATIISTFAIVPEPATLGLMLGATAVVIGIRRRRHR